MEKQSMLQKYTQLLQFHDWFYQYSDDPKWYRRGADEYDELMRYRRALIDNGLAAEEKELWERYRPVTTNTF